MRTKVLLALCLVTIALVAGCGGRKGISPQEIALVTFKKAHLSEAKTSVDSERLRNLVKGSNKTITYLMEFVGEAAAPDREVKKSDYWIIVILTRIGSSKAVNSLITILEHDYPGDVAEDRQIAARALVALGAKKAVSPLKSVIEVHKNWVDEQVAKGVLDESAGKQQIQNLEKYLENLKSGTDKLANTRDFM